MPRIRRLDLQAKIILVLVAVILPTFLLVTIMENKLTRPILSEEIRQLGITSGKTLAAEILSQQLLYTNNPSAVIETRMQEFLYTQPNIVRMDVIGKDPTTKKPVLIATNVEEEPAPLPPDHISENVESQYRTEESGVGIWDIEVPIAQQRVRDAKAPKKVIGSVHVVVTDKLVTQLSQTLWKITVAGAGISVIILILVLSYFLRKTIANDRKLRRAEDQNLELTAQLHEAQRQLMNTEKLAVMGQLTASFAHEIGTPLNAIGGHLQLLREELPKEALTSAISERVEIINGQLGKIERIVKGFLQNTAKPSSQRQLVDLNRLVDQTVGIVRPRIESEGIEVKRSFEWEIGPVRVVPLDLEQVLLNLLNNSLDSMHSKSEGSAKLKHLLEIGTKVQQIDGRAWAAVSVYDTGEGIRKADLDNVMKPFFTTKRPGEGTGLGLTICQQIARKYGGELRIESREGAWTRVTVMIPYQVQV